MNRPECLCPGYTQVETFGPDDEYEEEEEVVYVTLDLVDVDASLIPSSKAYRLMGLDTPNPFMQLSGTFLKGAYCSMMGSELIFVEDSKCGTDPKGVKDSTELEMGVKVVDNRSRRKDTIRYFSSCEQRVSFNDVRLYHKDDASAEVEPVVPECDHKEALDYLTGNADPSPRKKRKSKKDIDDAEAPSPPVQRRREKKVKPIPLDEHGNPLPKRKRGRPRKHPLPVVAETFLAENGDEAAE